MTWGTGVDSSKSYPAVLQDLLGDEYNVYNMGVGGEGSYSIGTRQGGITMNLVEGITIPATQEAVPVSFICSNGVKNAAWLSRINRENPDGGGINPCYIDGIKGELIREDVDDEIHYYFKRESAGEEHYVTKNTPIVTNAMKTRREDIVILFAGHNGSTSASKLITLYEDMIDYLDYENPKYIVLGLSPDKESTFEFHNAHEAELSEKYGEHFVNVREYMCSDQAFIDAGIEKTEDDKTDIANCMVPRSFRTDNIHYNEIGYSLLANKVYEKLCELGYVEIN